MATFSSKFDIGTKLCWQDNGSQICGPVVGVLFGKDPAGSPFIAYDIIVDQVLYTVDEAAVSLPN